MPNESWYVLVGGQQYGPYPLAAMEQFVAEGRVTPQSMLRQAETGDWAPAGQMLDLSHAPASAGGSPPGGLPAAGPIGYPPPPRSSRSTWIILAVVGGACLVLLVLCLGLPMLLKLYISVSPSRPVPAFPKVQVEVMPQTTHVEPESNKATNDFEIKGMKEWKIEWKEKDAKARPPLDEPAVKRDGPKTPVEAEPESRSP
jgi:hypothetical protein